MSSALSENLLKLLKVYFWFGCWNFFLLSSANCVMIPQSHLYLSSKILSISTSSFFNQCHFRFINAMYRHFSLSQLIPFSNPAIMSFFHLHCFQIAVFALKWIFPMEQIPINGVRTWKINQQAQKNGILCNPFLQLGTGCFYSLLPD